MKRLVALLALSGCASTGSPPITISAAISGIEADLTRNGVVSVSHAESWTGEQAASFESNVEALQCSQKNADPLVSMIAGPVTMNLTGSFTQSGSFSVTASGLSPVFGLQAEAQKTRSQALSVPVQFVHLSALADAEAEREVSYAGAMLAQNDALRHEEGARIQKSRQALSDRIHLLIAGYTGDRCGSPMTFGGARNGK